MKPSMSKLYRHKENMLVKTGEKKVKICVIFVCTKRCVQEKKYGKTEEGFQTLDVCCIPLGYMDLGL